MRKTPGLVLIACSIGLLASLVGGVFALVIFLASVTARIDFSPFAVRLALSGAFLAGAFVLYAIKKSRAQFVYGMLEVAVGLVSNWLSLDNWFHPTSIPGEVNVIYARLAILFAGIYIIVRGVTNAVEGFDRLFPGAWPLVRDGLRPARLRKIYAEAGQAPEIQVGTAEALIAKLEKKLAAAVGARKDTRSIQTQLEYMREQLRTVKQAQEKEFPGPDASNTKPAS